MSRVAAKCRTITRDTRKRCPRQIRPAHLLNNHGGEKKARDCSAGFPTCFEFRKLWLPTRGVSNVRLLKKLIAVVSLLAAGLAGGGCLGFALGYVIAGEGRNNVHGGAILVGLLTIGGAIAGLILGILTAYRVGQRVT
jgi:hypothetical protein